MEQFAAREDATQAGAGGAAFFDAATGRPAAADTSESGSYVAEKQPAQDELMALQRISHALAGKLDLEQILSQTLGVVGEVVGAEGASILVIDADTGGMTFRVAAGPGADVAKTVRLPPGAGICGQVARSGQPLIVNDAQHDARLFRGVDEATGTLTRNILCVPIRSSQRLWGVLEFINKTHQKDFGRSDLRLAEVVAAEIALALENSHLHGRIVREERMAAIGRTVSGLAHCIKNILNGIRAGAGVVDKSLAAEDQGELQRGWGVVRRNNQMLSNLVLDMLSLARESAVHIFPTDINDLAEQICELMGERAAQQDIRIQCIPAADLKDVPVDPTRFYRCLLNLVGNAIDACEEGGQVTVRVYRAGDKERVTVSVIDTGTGIDKATARRLFGEFFTTKGAKGTGLGLPVTKKLVEEMGGTIKFHSVPAHGTRFVMALPLGSQGDRPRGE